MTDREATPERRKRPSVAEQIASAGKPKRSRTDLAGMFLGFWQLSHGRDFPAPVREHRFHPTRRWRFDVAFPQIKLAIELHGGVWIGGGHNRGKHQQGDFDKINEAQILGWVVLQFGTSHLSKSQIADTLHTVLEAIGSIGERTRTQPENPS